jgi:hypothetical protein
MMIGGETLLRDINNDLSDDEGGFSDDVSVSSVDSQQSNDSDGESDTADYVLVNSGKFSGQFGKLRKDTSDSTRKKVNIVNKRGVDLNGKTSLLEDRYFPVIKNVNGTIDLDEILFASENSDAQQIRSEYLADHPEDSIKSGEKTKLRISRELSGLNTTSLVGER